MGKRVSEIWDIFFLLKICWDFLVFGRSGKESEVGPIVFIYLGCADRDEQMSSLDGHFPY